jgi:hypothetical protein
MNEHKKQSNQQEIEFSRFTEETMKKAIKEVNDEFQGKRNDNKCGIFVFGDADPWSVLGITSESEIGDCNRLIRIEGSRLADSS